MCDNLCRERWCTLTRHRDVIENAARQPGLVEELHRECLCARAELGRLDDDGVPADERDGDRADCQREGRIPWCDTKSTTGISDLII